jgi:hypothetical protein
MKLRNSFIRSVPALVLVFCAATFIPSAFADTIAWTHWTSATAGNATAGSATGTVNTVLYGTINVTYSGQTLGLLTNYPSWGPASTFTGGVVGNAPPAADNAIWITGGYSYTETVTFSQAVADPIFAIWSLGAPGVPAYFDFTSSEPFNVLGGGISNEYGGTGLTKSGNNIFGSEGNGIVQFIGTYTSISFTTPNYENYYALTFGEDDTLTTTGGTGTGTGTGVTPEPATLTLLGTGALAALGAIRRKR